MFTPSKFVIVVFAFALGACAATSRGKAAHVEGAPEFSRRVPHAEASTDTYGTSINGTTSQPGAQLSRSFESVTETTPPAGSLINAQRDERRMALAEQDKAQEPMDAAPPAVAHFAPPAPPAPPEGGQAPTHSPVAADVQPGQMLVYTANLTMAVYQVEQGLAAVERVALELDGYLATRGDLAITIRVPRAKFDLALKAIEGSGDVLHRDIKAEDVTDEFFDTEVRARNARAMRDRLAKLLQQAAVKEALEIEKELARVTQEIELLEGKLKLLRHRIAYSTINVAFRPRGTAIANRPTRLPFPWLEELGLRNLLRLGEGE
jgi:hypothetical protein